MSLNIPDKIYKLLILIGVLLIGYGFYKIENTEKLYFQEIEKYRTLSDSISILELKRAKKKSDLQKISINLSKTYNIKNQIKANDSTLIFNRALTGVKTNMLVSDSLQKLWLDYSNLSFKLKILDKKLSFADRYLSEEKNLKTSYLNNFKKILYLGYLFFFIGCIMWLIDSETDSSKKTKQHKRLYNYCQSCAKNFNSMRVYGKNKDDSMNFAFCSYCYDDGKFLEPGLTKQEAKERFLSSFQKNNRLKRFLANIRFNKIDRWT